MHLKKLYHKKMQMQILYAFHRAAVDQSLNFVEDSDTEDES